MEDNDFDLKKLFSDAQLFNLIYKGNTKRKRKFNRGAVAPAAIHRLCGLEIDDYMLNAGSYGKIRLFTNSVDSKQHGDVHILTIWIIREEWHLFSDLLVKVTHPQTGKPCFGFTDKYAFEDRINSLSRTKTYAGIMDKTYREIISSVVPGKLNSLNDEISSKHYDAQRQTGGVGRNFLGKEARGKLYFSNIKGSGVHTSINLYLIDEEYIWLMDRIGSLEDFSDSFLDMNPVSGVFVNAANCGFISHGTAGKAIVAINGEVFRATAVNRGGYKSNDLELTILTDLFEIKSKDVRPKSYKELEIENSWEH